MNKVILMGYVGGEPTVNETASGTRVASFTLATNETYKDAAGEKVTKTQWHKIVAWREMANFVSNWVKKGTPLMVEGKIETRSYEKDGVTLYVTEIVAQNFEFPPSSKKEREDEAPAQAQPKPAPRPTGATGADAVGSMPVPTPSDADDDLPF